MKGILIYVCMAASAQWVATATVMGMLRGVDGTLRLLKPTHDTWCMKHKWLMSEFESHGKFWSLGPKLAYLNEACIKLRKKPLYSGHAIIPIFTRPFYITSCIVHRSDNSSWFYTLLLDRLCWAKFRCDHAYVGGSGARTRTGDFSRVVFRCVFTPHFCDHLLEDIECVRIYWVRKDRCGGAFTFWKLDGWSSFPKVERYLPSYISASRVADPSASLRYSALMASSHSPVPSVVYEHGWGA